MLGDIYARAKPMCAVGTGSGASGPGQKLKAFREEAGLSQVQLGERVGVTGNDIAAYESGAVTISAARLWDFCEVFDVRPHHFFEDDG